MSLFEMVYADDAVSLACLVAIFYIVGANMADAVVRKWGWRAAAFGYVAFVLYASTHVNPTRAADLAYIAFRGLFAGGLAVGTTWMFLAIVLFFIRELPNVEQKIVVPSPPEQADPESSEQPTVWKRHIRNFDKLPPAAWQKFQQNRQLIESFEREARRLYEILRRPTAPTPVPPSVQERARLETQLAELKLARKFFEVSGEKPQEVGEMLAECKARKLQLKQALGRIPADRPGPPQLAGRAVYDEAVARLPHNPTVYVERARYLIIQGAHKEAIADSNQALKLLTNYHAALDSRGWAYHHLGQYSAAVRDFERAIYEYPPYDRAYVHLAATYNATGAYREATGPPSYVSVTNPAGQHQLAVAYENLNEPEQAVHHLTLLIQCDPNGEHVPDARVRRATQLLQLGQKELAMHDLKTQLARQPDAAAKRLLAQLESLFAFNRQAPDAAAPHDGIPASEHQFRIVVGA